MCGWQAVGIFQLQTGFPAVGESSEDMLCVLRAELLAFGGVGPGSDAKMSMQ